MKMFAKLERVIAAKIREADSHSPDCHWQLDQYSWECTCGVSQAKARLRAGRWLLSWALYWLADRVDAWLVGHDEGRWSSFWADVYQWLMRLSASAQGDGRGPWKSAE